MDDFGAGYSSLSYLQSFPFDKVKIDRSFTCELDQSRKSNAIVQAVASLCDGLDMAVAAEGVETEGQFAALRREGCSEAQGFLFSRPVRGEGIAGAVAEIRRERGAGGAADDSPGERRPDLRRRSRQANFRSISSRHRLDFAAASAPQAKNVSAAPHGQVKQFRDRYCGASAKIRP